MHVSFHGILGLCCESNSLFSKSQVAMDHNGLGIGEEGAFEKRQLGLCTKAK
jgi:hypothetical protein